MLTEEYASRAIKEKIEEFIIPLSRKGLKAITLNNYRELLYRDLWFLHEDGRSVVPSKITASDIEFLIEKRWTGAPKYNHNRRSVFFRFLQYHNNNLVKEYPMPVNSCVRTTIGPDKWLSDEEAIAMYLACEDPVERWVCHAELKLGLRRFDLTNIMRDDVFSGYVDVLGKGGKRAPVAFVGDTSDVLRELYLHLERVIDGVKDPPRSLLLYRIGSYRPKVGVFKKTALDNMIKRIAKRAGIDRPVTHHMLRRTCARMWLRSGASIDEISMMLRHSSKDTTMIYLGLTVDDLKKGAMRFDDYFNAKKANFRGVENSQMKGVSQIEKVDRARFELAASTMPR